MMWRRTVTPSRPGRRRSRMTRSYRRVLTRLRASSPSSDPSTANPADASARETKLRMRGSSSTTSTRAMVLVIVTHHAELIMTGLSWTLVHIGESQFDLIGRERRYSLGTGQRLGGKPGCSRGACSLPKSGGKGGGNRVD